MILALVKVLIAAGYDPAKHIWVQAIDVVRNAAHSIQAQRYPIWKFARLLQPGDMLP